MSQILKHVQVLGPVLPGAEPLRQSQAHLRSELGFHPGSLVYSQTRVPVGAADATFATLHPGRGVLKPDELFTQTSHQIREAFLSNTFLSLHHAPTAFFLSLLHKEHVCDVS